MNMYMKARVILMSTCLLFVLLLSCNYYPHYKSVVLVSVCPAGCLSKWAKWLQQLWEQLFCWFRSVVCWYYRGWEGEEQSCQPLRLGRIYYAWGHCTMLLGSWLYHSALPLKNGKKQNSILCTHVGIKCTSSWLHVWHFCVCGVGCATASWCSRFKPADQS